MRQALILILLAIALSGSDVKYDGAQVHYESYGRGNDAIVFIHGWTCDLTFWRGQAPVYEKHRSLLIDLPGHGQSEKPDVAYTQERFARAIEAVMQKAGVERAVLVGHSMGGPVALTFMRLFPAKTKALVLVDAYLPQAPKNDGERAQKKQMEAFAARWRAPNYKESAEAMIDSMFSLKTTPAQRMEIASKMLTTPQHVMASAFEGMLALEPLKPGETYDVPTMAVMAERTPGLSGYEARLRAIFPNLVTYEGWQGSGHFLMLESPERFNSALEGFLAALK
jgi:pimeloyl-ACP methyl ester carboxylesterase